MVRHWLIVIVSIALAAPAAAQPLRVRLTAGTRVRVSAPPRAGWIAGTVVLADSDRVVLRDGARGVPDTVLLATVQALELSHGHPRAARTIGGALFGGLIGAGLGALIATVASGPRTEDTDLVTLGGAAAGLAAGLVVGAAVGAATAPERWKPVVVR